MTPLWKTSPRPHLGAPPPRASAPVAGRGSRRLGRALLAAGALGVAFAGTLGPGCAATFDPPSKVNTLRVFSVVADKPYANPGDEVTFTMSYADGLPRGQDTEPRPVQITWLGGCFNPDGDEYFGCYEDIGAILQGLSNGDPSGLEYVAQGVDRTTFTLRLPETLVSERPAPEVGPHYGIAYLFFAACAGKVQPVDPEGTGEAGSFPLGCFDDAGNRLGAESFVPGYTQIYAFADERPNQNPEILGLAFDGVPLEEDPEAPLEIAACPVSAEERRVGGCGNEDPFVACENHEVRVEVPDSVAELDPDAQGPDGEPLTETVWVDYYADGGDIKSDVKLVNDSLKGLIAERETKWIPPPEPGPVRFWAVVHDARGGSAIVERTIVVR